MSIDNVFVFSAVEICGCNRSLFHADRLNCFIITNLKCSILAFVDIIHL